MSIRKPQELGSEALGVPSEAVFPGGLVVDLTTDDFDEMASIAPRWDQEYLKFGKGTFKGRVLGIHTNRVQIGKVTWEPGILARGAAPPRAITLAMLLTREGAASSQGMVLEEHHILVLKPGQEFELSVLGKSTLLVVVVEEALFRRYSLARWGEPFVLRDGRDRVVVRQMREQETVCRKWENLISDIIDNRNLLDDSFSARSMEEKLLDNLLSNALGAQPSHLGPLRRQAAKRAEQYLITNVEKPLSLADLCAAARANERTLLVGFHEVFGMSPKLFLKSFRLNRARQDLRRGSPGTRVTDVAIRWGFNHLSRFAADYRHMFGELPHETLRNRPRRQPDPVFHCESLLAS
jgi:AraC family ethanolamine operon transcriptional activator